MTQTPPPTKDPFEGLSEGLSEEDAARLREVLRRGAQEHDAFLRDDFADTRRRVILVCGSLVVLCGVFVILVLLEDPIQPLQVFGAAVPGLLALALTWRWWRCPKCDRPPVHPATLVHARNLSHPTSCPHCGFDLVERAPEEA